MLKFEILKQEGLMRAGVITTAHGEIRTPAFVGAATRATVKTLTAEQMKRLGSQAVLANTYHLILAPGSDLVARAGGLAKFMSWHAPTFTDSGGFQIMSLPGVKVDEGGASFKSHINGDKLIMTPESSMQAQWEIGADIHMAFDCPVGYGVDAVPREETQRTMERTHRWAERCLAKHERLIEHEKLKCGKYVAGVCLDTTPYVVNSHITATQSLYGVVQGGDFEDLRRESAEWMAARNFDGYGIGGMYSAEKGRSLLSVMNEILPVGRPRHWLGMGQEPRDLFVGAEFGCDTFDCVGPTRMARNGTLYTHDGRIAIRNARFREDFAAVDAKCDCELCAGGYSAAYLHHLFKVDEITGKVLASIHNERFVVRLTEQIRAAILEGRFAEFRDRFLARYYASK